jgi:hypothetical protein
MGKVIIKGATQVSGHALKLYFCMFEKSQRKHNSLDCHNIFWHILHYLQTLDFQNLTQIKNVFTYSKHSNLENEQSLFFSNVFFLYQMCNFLKKNWRGF